MKNHFVCFCCVGMCAAAFGQDIQSGMWYADGRSTGLGGSLFAIGNECFMVKITDDNNLMMPDDGGDSSMYSFSIGALPLTPRPKGRAAEAALLKFRKCETSVNKVSDTLSEMVDHVSTVSCKAYVNGLLPYCMGDLAVLSAGAVVDWKQYSWWLHGGWSGDDEQFVSLLFGHTVAEKWRYVVGMAVYRLDIGFITGNVSLRVADDKSLNTKGEAGTTGMPRTVWAFMAEAGMFYRPLESLQIGVWMGNPTLTHVDSLYFATDFHLGAVYDASERLQFVLEFEKQLQQSFFAHAGMEMAIWRQTGKSRQQSKPWHSADNTWRVDGRVGVRYPHTEMSAGLGIARYGKVKLHFDAAAVCDWKLGWSFSASVGVGL